MKSIKNINNIYINEKKKKKNMIFLIQKKIYTYISSLVKKYEIKLFIINKKIFTH